MVGLVIVVVFGCYLIISTFVVLLVAKWAKKRGRTAWIWGWLAAFGMYSLVFWDWLPTLAIHEYRCEAEAGFWVYITPEQWKADNPDIADMLIPSDGVQFMNGGYSLNQRFRRVVETSGPHFLNIWRHEHEVIDKQTGRLMARYVDFSSGYGNPLVGVNHGWQGFKVWLSKSHCPNGRLNKGKLYAVSEAFAKIGETQ